jgi:hypothetical protein
LRRLAPANINHREIFRRHFYSNRCSQKRNVSDKFAELDWCLETPAVRSYIYISVFLHSDQATTSCLMSQGENIRDAT